VVRAVMALQVVQVVQVVQVAMALQGVRVAMALQVVRVAMARRATRRRVAMVHPGHPTAPLSHPLRVAPHWGPRVALSFRN